MDELDGMVRESLRARADDVEATPALWREVRRRRDRRRRARAATVSLAAAAAVALAAVAVPPLVRTVRSEAPEVLLAPPADPARPTEEAPGPADVSWRAVATDGASLFLLEDGGAAERFLELPEAGESTIVALAVRPGSTADDLTVAWLAHAEGAYDLRWTTLQAGAAHTGRFADTGHDVANREPGGSTPSPVWSPDGREVAWVEDAPDGTPTLRAVGWGADGPGTGGSGSVEAALAGLDHAERPRAVSWTWSERDAEQARGTVHVSHDDPGAIRDAAVEVARSPSGGLEITGQQLVASTLARASEQAGEAAADYLLEATPDGGLRLWWTGPGGEGGGEVTPPDLLGEGLDDGPAWLAASGERILAGSGRRAWLLDRSGAAAPLEGEVVHADFVD